MRRYLLTFALLAFSGGTAACGGTGKQVAAHASHYAVEVGKCVAEKIGECVARPLEGFCPDCQRVIRGAMNPK